MTKKRRVGHFMEVQDESTFVKETQRNPSPDDRIQAESIRSINTARQHLNAAKQSVATVAGVRESNFDRYIKKCHEELDKLDREVRLLKRGQSGIEILLEEAATRDRKHTKS